MPSEHRTSDMEHDYADMLGLSEYDFEKAFDSFDERSYEDTVYYSLPDYHTKLERGTVLFDGEVVRGFPKVPRTLVLAEGVPRYFSDTVYVEEKMNGFNVRVARVDDSLLAFTRSGIVCPFTTMYLRRRYGGEIEALIDSHPDCMVCGELVGADNPYTRHPYPEVDSLELRVFDVRRQESGEPLPVEERREVVDSHGLPQVRLLGVHEMEEAASEVRDTIGELDAENREGVLMKSADVGQQLKYTTSAANQDDLAFAFTLPFDYGQAFMFRRIIREAFQSHEDDTEEERRERAHRLGESILGSMTETIERVDRGETVGEEHSVKAKPEEVEVLLDHLRDQGLHLVIEEDRVEDGERYVEFVKKTQATQDKTGVYLDGKIVRE